MPRKRRALVSKSALTPQRYRNICFSVETIQYQETPVISPADTTMTPEIIDLYVDITARAMTTGPSMTEQEQASSHAVIRTLVLAFMPVTVMQLAIACQVAMFQLLTVQAARGVLCGAPEDQSKKAQSNLIALGRLTAKHLDTLRRLQTPAPGRERPEKCAPSPAQQMGAPMGSNEVPPELETSTPGQVPVAPRPSRAERRHLKALALKTARRARAMGAGQMPIGAVHATPS